MGGPLSSVTTWGCQSPRRADDMMTKRCGLNAQGCLCTERDMPKCCLKRSYLRGTLMENGFFYSVVLAGGPNCVSLIIISLLGLKTAFVLRFHKEEHSWTGFFLDGTDWKWLIWKKKFDFKVKFRKEQEYSISLWCLTSGALGYTLWNKDTNKPTCN